MKHYIFPNRVGFYISGIDYQPVFYTYNEALEWAREGGITIHE